MLSRALMIATVTLLIGCLTAVGARAQENLERWQEPFPDILGHLQRLPQEPAGPVEECPGFVAAGLSAPALYDGQPNGLAACLVSHLQRRCRPALPGEGSAEAERRQTGRKAGPTRPLRPPATAGRTGDGGLPARIRGGEADGRGRAARPRCQTAGKAERNARR